MTTIKSYSEHAQGKKMKPETIYVFENYDGLNFSFSSKVDKKVDPTENLIGKVLVYNSCAFANENELNEYTILLAKKAWHSGMNEYFS